MLSIPLAANILGNVQESASLGSDLAPLSSCGLRTESDRMVTVSGEDSGWSSLVGHDRWDGQACYLRRGWASTWQERRVAPAHRGGYGVGSGFRPDPGERRELSEMSEGTVITLSRDRGHGFILSNEGQIVYFHPGAVEVPDDQCLSNRDRVRFETVDGLNGPVASRIRRLRAASPMSGSGR